MENTVDILKRIPYFETLPEQVAERLASHVRVIEAKKGEFIFHAGDPPEGLYYLTSGRAKAVRYSADGRELTIKEFLPGETFNEVGALNAARNPSSCLALENETRILLVPAQPLIEVLKEFPEVDYKIMKAMAVKLQYAMNKMDRLALMDVKSRLAAHLLEEAGDSGVLRVSEEDLATRLGTVRQVVGRALGELQKQGAVRVERGRIEILSREQLEELIELDH